MTTGSSLCPQCQTPLTVGDRYCSGCGVDLAVVTLLLEYSAMSKKPSQTPPFLPDTVVPRLGEFLFLGGEPVNDLLRRDAFGGRGIEVAFGLLGGDRQAHSKQQNGEGENSSETRHEIGFPGKADMLPSF